MKYKVHFVIMLLIGLIIAYFVYDCISVGGVTSSYGLGINAGLTEVGVFCLLLGQFNRDSRRCK
jgi:hypothetical protein